MSFSALGNPLCSIISDEIPCRVHCDNSTSTLRENRIEIIILSCSLALFLLLSLVMEFGIKFELACWSATVSAIQSDFPCQSSKGVSLSLVVIAASVYWSWPRPVHTRFLFVNRAHTICTLSIRQRFCVRSSHLACSFAMQRVQVVHFIVQREREKEGEGGREVVIARCLLLLNFSELHWLMEGYMFFIRLTLHFPVSAVLFDLSWHFVAVSFSLTVAEVLSIRTCSEFPHKPIPSLLVLFICFWVHDQVSPVFKDSPESLGSYNWTILIHPQLCGNWKINSQNLKLRNSGESHPVSSLVACHTTFKGIEVVLSWKTDKKLNPWLNWLSCKNEKANFLKSKVKFLSVNSFRFLGNSTVNFWHVLFFDIFQLKSPKFAVFLYWWLYKKIFITKS